MHSEKSEPAVGFVGFGEAGYHIALGLRGSARLFAFDINADAPGLGARIRRRAEDAGVTLTGGSADLARSASILLSVVTADAALEAASQSAPFLGDRHWYADLNSVSPATKKAIGHSFAGTAVHWVEGVIMAPVPRHGHRVPILINGDEASGLMDRLVPLGMRLERMDGPAGAAAAVKMCRSIVMKGLEAAMLECAATAAYYGASARVFASLDESMPGIDWRKMAAYMIGRVYEHGERRAREMEEVAETVRASGVEPIMAEAAARRQDWPASLHLLSKDDPRAPRTPDELVAVLSDGLAPEPAAPGAAAAGSCA